MTRTDIERKRGQRAISVALTAVALAVAVLPFVAPRIPVGNDVFKHLLIARVFTSYGDPILKYRNQFELTVRPVSNILCWVTLAGLMKLVGPIAAARIYLVLVTLALWYFSRRLAAALELPATAALVALPLSQSKYVFCGNLPFIASMAIYPALLWVLVKHRPGIGRTIRIVVALVVLYGFHIVGYAIGCLTVALFAVTPAAGPFWKRHRGDSGVLWGDLASVALTAALPVFQVGPMSGQPLYIHYFPLVNHFKSLLANTVWPLSRSAGIPLLIGILALFGWSLRQVVSRRTERRFTALWVALLLLLAILPFQINLLSPAGPRLLPFAIIAAIGVVHLSPRGWNIAGLVATSALVIAAALNTKAAMAVQPACEEFLSGMNTVAYGSRVLPVIKDMFLGGNVYCGPFFGIEDAYTIFRGGSNPYCFAAPYWPAGAHVLKYRSYDGASAYKLDPLSPKQSYAGVSKHYDYVLIFGNLPFVSAQVSQEMQLCYSRGRLQVFGGPGKCVAPRSTRDGNAR